MHTCKSAFVCVCMYPLLARCRRERLNTLSQQNRARQKDKSSSTGGGDRSPRHQEAGQPTKNESTLGQKAPEDPSTSLPAGGKDGDSGVDPLHQPSGESGGAAPQPVADSLHHPSRDVGGEAPQTILDPLRYPAEDPPVSVTLHQPPGESGGGPPQVLEPLHQPADYAAATPSHYQMSNNTFDNFVIAMHRKVVSTLQLCVEGGEVQVWQCRARSATMNQHSLLLWHLYLCVTYMCMCHLIWWRFTEDFCSHFLPPHPFSSSSLSLLSPFHIQPSPFFNLPPPPLPHSSFSSHRSASMVLTSLPSTRSVWLCLATLWWCHVKGAPIGSCMLRCGGKYRDCSQRTPDSHKGTREKGIGY